jgi:predicted metal-dependent enzyme (double-stranded beta helix superfamily)
MTTQPRTGGSEGPYEDKKAFTHFIKSVQAMREEGMDESSLVQAVARNLAKRLEVPDWLEPKYREGWLDRYRPHLLYVAPDGSFSVVCLVWRPGQKTPIHDRVARCV